MKTGKSQSQDETHIQENKYPLETNNKNSFITNVMKDFVL